MKKEFVPYELAVRLQTLGFDQPCICGYDKEGRLRGKLAHGSNGEAKIGWDIYDDHIPTPLWQQVTQWLRDKHKLNVFIGFRPNVKKWDSHAYDMKLNGKEYIRERTMEKFMNEKVYDDYHDALAAGIEEALKRIDNGK